ncbi:hypothetical protein A33M_0685 [Rhodovulum sp. PH10]|uniref:hypothetical protein n=1 Tax=Rhodovulum sp. PH10 TaxID=1187851 RepID=UPI00027C2C9A|nr:hypothetical protein [Rhodovulum sp. PH10]EJW09973.1 hypothetical protein A33M_0685 [Rhodovulum sp. PH10]
MTRWGWGAFVVAVIATFGLLEGWALATDTPTLSQTVWWASAAFPLLGPLVGFVVGGLFVHFWWPNQGPGKD